MTRPGTWRPGQSGNPRGRVRSSIREQLKRVAAEKLPDGRTNSRAVAEKAFELAEQGNLAAMQWLAEQVDGRLPQPTELTGAGGGPLEVVVDHARGALAARLAALAARQRESGGAGEPEPD